LPVEVRRRACGGSTPAARPPCPAPRCLRAPAALRRPCHRSRARRRGGAARAQVRQSAGLLLKNNVKENYATTTDEYRRYIKVRGGPAAPACARTVTRADSVIQCCLAMLGVRAARRLPRSRRRRRGCGMGPKAGVCGGAAGAAACAWQPQQGAAARGRDQHRGHRGRRRPGGLAGAARAAGAMPGEQRCGRAGGRARRAVQGAAPCGAAGAPASGLQGAGAAVWPARRRRAPVLSPPGACSHRAVATSRAAPQAGARRQAPGAAGVTGRAARRAGLRGGARAAGGGGAAGRQGG